MNDYDEYRRKKMESAMMFQDFVVDVSWNMLGLAIVQYSSKQYQYAVGESKTGCEIKFDMKYEKTGNLYIETGEKAEPREGDYFPSGIYREDNTWLYIIGNYERIFYCPKNILQILHKTGKYRQVENDTKTSIGFLVPEKRMWKFSATVAEPKSAADGVQQVARSGAQGINR